MENGNERMNVFISSVIGGLETYRDASAAGISSLGHTAKRSEDYGASPESSQTACLRGVRDADCIILILGERYGQVQESGLSATHEEYREAREHVDVVAFLQRGVTSESAQKAFIAEVRDWASGTATESFADAAELQGLVTRRLAELQVARATGSVEPEELLERAHKLATIDMRTQSPAVSIIVVPGPRQTVIPPVQMDDPNFRARLQQEAEFGELPLLDRLKDTIESIEGDTLVIEQDGGRISIDERGAIRIDQEVRSSNGFSMPVLIEEQITAAVERAVRFAGWLLDQVDDVRRLSDVAILAGFVNCPYYAWRTLAEDAANPGSVTMSRLGDHHFIELSRPVSKRAGLLHDAQALVEDIVARLRRLAKTNG